MPGASSESIQSSTPPRSISAIRMPPTLRVPYFVIGYAYAFGRAAFHESLKVQRSAFVAEVDVAFLYSLDTSDRGVLAQGVLRVRPQQVRVNVAVRDDGQTVVLGGDTGPDRFPHGQGVVDQLIRCHLGILGESVVAGQVLAIHSALVIDQDSLGNARATPSRGGTRLIGAVVPVDGRGVAIESAIVTQRVPVAGAELDQSFRIVAEVVIVDGVHLQRREVGLREVYFAQRAERKGQHEMLNVGHFIKSPRGVLERAGVGAVRVKLDSH